MTIRYTSDKYLDQDKRHIRVYHNTYPIEEVISSMEDYGFKVRPIKEMIKLKRCAIFHIGGEFLLENVIPKTQLNNLVLELKDSICQAWASYILFPWRK